MHVMMKGFRRTAEHRGTTESPESEPLSGPIDRGHFTDLAVALRCHQYGLKAPETFADVPQRRASAP